MSKQVYISADYDQNNGDQAVVEELTKWGRDNLHKVDRTHKTQTALRRVKYPAPLRLTRMAISGVLMVALIFTMNLNRQKRRKRRSSSSIIPHEKKQTGSPLT